MRGSSQRRGWTAMDGDGAEIPRASLHGRRLERDLDQKSFGQRG